MANLGRPELTPATPTGAPPASAHPDPTYARDALQDVQALRSTRLPALPANLSLSAALSAYAEAPTAELEQHLHQLAQQNTQVFTNAAQGNDGDWMDQLHWQGYPRETYTMETTNELLKALHLSPDSPEGKAINDLSIKMWQNSRSGARLHSYMLAIAKRHGAAGLAQICKKLSSYMREHWNDGHDAKPIDEAKLVEDILKDVAYPCAIGQESKNTCAAVSIQSKLAAERPLQYVDMVTTLASGRAYTTPDGTVMKPNTSWQGDASDDRRLSEKILQNAIMDLGGVPYDTRVNRGGMSRESQETAVEHIFGYRGNDFDSDTSEDVGPDRLWQYVEDDLAHGRPVSVSLPGHAVLVVGFDPTKQPPQVLISTWGGLYTMDLDQFKQYVQAVRTVDDPWIDDKKLPHDRKTYLLQ